MSIYKELSYDHEVQNIKGIRFCIMSPEEIQRMSVAEIFKTDTYVSTEPVVNGLFDPRMGVLDHNKVCLTCEQKNTFCPGHFGHINLAKPVFYIQFFDIVKKLLKCVCFRCSKLLINTESDQIKAILNRKYSRQKRWELLYKLCSKVKRCGQDTIDGCGAKQPDKIYREPIVKIIMEWKDLGEESKKQIMSAEEVLRILKRISDKDAEILGFSRKYNRPEWMICTTLPVPPPSVRPSVRTDTGQRSEDDLTHKLCDIVKSNNALKMKIEKGASKEQIDIAAQVLQYHVATFIDNKIPGINPAQQRTGRLLKSITERLKSKDGRIRGNLMGKRVDFSARSVITPDPNISIDELGVPIKIAMNLTFPEVVNQYNRTKLMEFVINGPDKYPGARFIRKGSWTKALKNMPNRSDIVLEDGDIVDRHLIDGDYVLFNRQPSLHKYSMLCHRVKVMPFNTFRLNVSVCGGYNADFDGDEMNAHCPQSITTANELIELASVSKQIISARECKPIIGVVQDVALGIFRISKGNVRLNERNLFNLLASNLKFTGNVPDAAETAKSGVSYWTGRQMMSSIIPKNVNIKSANKSYEEKDGGDNENFVVIENGELQQGTLDKTIFQNRTRGLIHSIFSECGPEETRIFLDNTQKLVCDWLVLSGFSVGISDLLVNEKTMGNLKNMIHDMKVQVYDIIRDIHAGNFENKSINNNSSFFEDEVNKILNTTISKVGKVALSQLNDQENRMINMVKSGSKGSIINVSQMIACLGQQNVDGKRIPYGFEDRTLPHFTKYDDGPESRGFVENSFIKGLSPAEFFFHAMGGREGLIDTAVKSVTGDTDIIIIENGRPKSVQIGEWIDAHMERCKDRVQYKEEKHTELLELDTEVYIPNMDSKGNMMWSTMKYVTRHDPDEVLYEVETCGGRKVIVTKYDSLLVWDHEKKEFLTKATPDIKIDDIVPVTYNMPKPPIILSHVDVSDYLPKTKFLYGTDFHKAVAMMKEAMEGKYMIPTGWWNAHNGKEFTLPYTKKARLQRVLVRSDVENIKEGCVNNYDAQRGECSIPDKFPLDKEFGTFIGLYLAEGSCHIRSGKVCVSNNDENVLTFLRSWFDKYHITHKTYKRDMDLKNAEGEVVSKGTTCSIQGSSTMLAKFLDKFVGHGAQNKFIPQEAYAAPEEFIVGLLNGYFGGDGWVGKNSMAVTSASKDLIYGVVHLCSRLGVYGKIYRHDTKKNNLGTKNILPTYTLDIRSCFAQSLSEKVDFIVGYKNEALKHIKCSKQYMNKQNDVVKDHIKTITQIDISQHPKVYDVTVPGTYNFTIKNGLCQHDTSETGYLQRKLVKAMEDCKINYDSTVRNASGSIVQFLYGEDGMDPTKIESQPLPYIDMDLARLRKEYAINSVEDVKHTVSQAVYDELTKNTKWIERTEAHFDQILQDREFMIKKIFNCRKETSIMYPVSFMRIINNAKAFYGKFDKGVALDITPDYILDEIETMCKELFINNNNMGNKFLNILLRCYLSPKKVLNEYKFNRLAFDNVTQQIRLKFYDAIAHPSECVGVVAAQSIGEPATQLTLNTFHLSGTSSASKAVRGVPRIKELLSVTKNVKSPSLTIFVDKQVAKDKLKCKDILNSIETTYFKDVVTSTKIFYDPDDFNTSIDEDKLFVASYKEFMDMDLMKVNNASPWLLRMEFSKDKMLEYGVTMIDIYHVLQDFYDDNISAMFSDDNAKKLVFRLKINDDGSDTERDIITELKALEKNIMENMIIKGVKKINKVSMSKREYVEYQDDTMTFENTHEWVLETSGSNLLDIMCHKAVDASRTVSNNINEIYEILGIEAARQALYNELSDVIKDADLYVNYRHIALLVDTMTNKGYLLSIDRHGINRVDIGPLARASFEETTDMLIKAGIFSEVDRINGVSANIMLGQIPPCGTGDTEVLMDELKLMESITQQIITQKEDKETTAAHEAACMLDNFTFMDFTMPDKDSTITPKNTDIKIVS